MKHGDSVIWARSPERSILDGWRVQRIPGVVVRIYRHRVKISIRSDETERLTIVDPDNLFTDDGTGDIFFEPDSSA